LERVGRGESGAADELLDRFGGLVWSLARKLSSTESDAEDAAQEIFLDIWKSASRYDPSVAAEATFVAMIARRRLIDRRRKAGRRPDEVGIVEEAEPDATRVPLDAADAELADDAREAMEGLSDEQQRVLQLSIFHGLSHDRIARATQMPLGTVKTHARRGMIRLRGLLDQARTRKNSQNREVIS